MTLEIALGRRRRTDLLKTCRRFNRRRGGSFASAHSDPQCKTINPSAKAKHKSLSPKWSNECSKRVWITRHGYFSFLGLPGGRAWHSTRFVKSLCPNGISDGPDGQVRRRVDRTRRFPTSLTPSRKSCTFSLSIFDACRRNETERRTRTSTSMIEERTPLRRYADTFPSDGASPHPRRHAP
jgi:hypothetical protein